MSQNTLVADADPRVSREELILEAADRLLARYGYRKMTIDDLAREAGIGKGTVYLHFRSKEDVVLSHMERLVNRVLARLKEIAASDAPPAAKLSEMLVARVMVRFDGVQHYTESISEVLRDLRGPLLQRREGYFEEEAKVLSGVLREGQRAGAFRRHEALATARTLILASNSLLPFSLSTQELGKRREVEQAAGRIADLVLEGLLAD
ncbi:MAG TPA: helix-turn-helix domain-containing protein [Chthoniobacterales bacterium]|nr:helix-turn-helix domain-containing protein [Chthoniobacterales bacterium]